MRWYMVLVLALLTGCTSVLGSPSNSETRPPVPATQPVVQKKSCIDYLQAIEVPQGPWERTSASDSSSCYVALMQRDADVSLYLHLTMMDAKDLGEWPSDQVNHFMQRIVRVTVPRDERGIYQALRYDEVPETTGAPARGPTPMALKLMSERGILTVRCSTYSSAEDAAAGAAKRKLIEQNCPVLLGALHLHDMGAAIPPPAVRPCSDYMNTVQVPQGPWNRESHDDGFTCQLVLTQRDADLRLQLSGKILDPQAISEWPAEYWHEMILARVTVEGKFEVYQAVRYYGPGSKTGGGPSFRPVPISIKLMGERVGLMVSCSTFNDDSVDAADGQVKQMLVEQKCPALLDAIRVGDFGAPIPPPASLR